MKQGYVGKIRGVHMTVSTDAFVPTMPERYEGAFHASNLPIPEKYELLAKSGLNTSAQDLAYLYAAYASDKKNGTSEASNFYDVRQHDLIDEIYKMSEEFFR